MLEENESPDINGSKKMYDKFFLLNIREQVKKTIPVLLDSRCIRVLGDVDVNVDDNSKQRFRPKKVKVPPLPLFHTRRVVPPPPQFLLSPKVIKLTREEVKLHKADDAWKPSFKRKAADQQKDSEEWITDDIARKVQGILNKLTSENFPKLVQNFVELPFEDKEERIFKAVKVVFENAVDIPFYSKEFAKLVYIVCNLSQETSRRFREQILGQCQQEFQKDNSKEGKIKELEQKHKSAEEDEKDMLKAELDEMKFQMRIRSLGNVKFIGELHKLQMLTPKVMTECVGMLICSTDEESFECLCKLLTTAGQKLEEQLKEIELKVEAVKNCQNKEDRISKMPKFIPEDKWMTKIFNIIRNLSDNKKMSSRIRFALLDVYELRDNYWKPRRHANASNTTTEGIPAIPSLFTPEELLRLQRKEQKVNPKLSNIEAKINYELCTFSEN